jgi:hypothetical protein
VLILVATLTISLQLPLVLILDIFISVAPVLDTSFGKASRSLELAVSAVWKWGSSLLTCCADELEERVKELSTTFSPFSRSMVVGRCIGREFAILKSLNDCGTAAVSYLNAMSTCR